MKAKAHVVLLCFCSILLIIGLTGCAVGGTSFSLASSGKATSASDKSADEQKLDETVFPKDKVVDVKITIDAAEFQNLLDNASAEEYKEATVEYNGQTFKNVGIRAKGNLSLRSVVNMTDSDRYSFKISFDEYVNQTLEGITKINLNNNYSDASYMREFLSYELAEDMGLPTPKYSYVNVYVNDELWGFYLAVEQIGDSYLERHFDNAYGALYKANGGTGSELNWLSTIESYTGLDLKSDKSNDDILLDMLDELNNGTDIESLLDVDEALAFIALNVLTSNMDSYLGQNKHNYYLYEDDGVFNVLPWDYNMAFGGLGGSGILIDEPTTGTLTDRPLVAKLLAVDEYKETYHNILAKAIEGYLSGDAFAARVQEIRDMISSYVKADPSSFYTYDEYESGITSVLSLNTTQTTSIAKQLDGTIASSGDGSGSGGGMGGGGFGGMGGGRGGNRQNAQQNTGQNAAAPAANAENADNNGHAAANEQSALGNPAPAVELAAAGVADAGNAAADGQMPQGDADAAAPGGQMPDGGMQGGFGGQRPDGQGGGMGGGGFGGPGGPGTLAVQPKGSPKEAATVGITLIILLLSCVFIAFYKRKRL
ncbi:CotH kinase family protein [Paenibacillus sp. FJAT-27812]|uniref:CotH kinase family protein n=1 Tax=Paenibacillus sp. FJAT-27812 TaxID=1684143 RepID=UPI0006A79583|nr:CotH kinase family protein [Paenibacillus sp. FJAT-27812]